MVWNSLLVNHAVVKSHLVSTLPFKNCLHSRTQKHLHSFSFFLDHFRLQLSHFHRATLTASFYSCWSDMDEQNWAMLFVRAHTEGQLRTRNTLGLHFQCCNWGLWPACLADKLVVGHADLYRASVFVSMRVNDGYVGTHSLRLIRQQESKVKNTHNLHCRNVLIEPHTKKYPIVQMMMWVNFIQFHVNKDEVL